MIRESLRHFQDELAVSATQVDFERPGGKSESLGTQAAKVVGRREFPIRFDRFYGGHGGSNLWVRPAFDE